MITLATTTVTITRVVADPTRDGYDTPPAATTIVSGVRATLYSPGSQTALVGGEQVTYDTDLAVDPCGIAVDDVVTDDATGVSYRVLAVIDRAGFGLDHIKSHLRRVEGAAA